MLARSVGNFRAFDSFRSALEEPGEDNGNGKAKDDEKNNRADRPVRNVENRKYLRDSLRKRPAGDGIGHRYLVDIAPLQFSEEVAALHFEDARNSRVGTIFSASASKRGSPRSGVRSGSTRIGPMLKPSRS